MSAMKLGRSAMLVATEQHCLCVKQRLVSVIDEDLSEPEDKEELENTTS